MKGTLHEVSSSHKCLQLLILPPQGHMFRLNPDTYIIQSTLYVVADLSEMKSDHHHYKGSSQYPRMDAELTGSLEFELMVVDI